MPACLSQSSSIQYLATMFYEPTTLAMTTNVLATALQEEYGIDPEPVFRAAGIDMKQTHSPQSRYPLSTMKKLWAAAVKATGDPTIGLKTGWHITPAHYYALGFSWLASESLLGALLRVQRYMRVVSTAAVELDIREEGDCYAVSVRFPDESRSPPKEGIDAGMTALLKLCDLVTHTKVRPRRIDLTCPSNIHPQAYREHLGPNIRFRLRGRHFLFRQGRARSTALRRHAGCRKGDRPDCRTVPGGTGSAQSGIAGSTSAGRAPTRRQGGPGSRCKSPASQHQYIATPAAGRGNELSRRPGRNTQKSGRGIPAAGQAVARADRLPARILRSKQFLARVQALDAEKSTRVSARLIVTERSPAALVTAVAKCDTGRILPRSCRTTNND